MLCPDCAVARPTLTAPDLVVCIHCGAPARVLTRPKRIDPYWIAVGTFIRNMLSKEGLVQLSALGLGLYLAKLIPGWAGAFITGLIFASYFFQVINRAAQGEEHLPPPADFLGFDSFLVVTRYGIATLLIWGPAVAYALWGISWWELSKNPVEIITQRLFDPIVVLLFLAGVCYYPAALIAGGVADSILAMLAPWITIRMILRIPGQYFLTVAVWIALSMVDWLWTLLVSTIVSATPIAIIPSIMGEILKLPIPLVLAFVLGRLIFQNAEHFGVVKDEMLQEPLVPGAVPRGQRESLR